MREGRVRGPPDSYSSPSFFIFFVPIHTETNNSGSGLVLLGAFWRWAMRRFFIYAEGVNCLILPVRL